jgi:hypothetical protein
MKQKPKAEFKQSLPYYIVVGLGYIIFEIFLFSL